MNTLIELEKKINSELTTKIDKSSINHNQLYLEINKEDLIDVILFLKTNKDTKFRQLIAITAVDGDCCACWPCVVIDNTELTGNFIVITCSITGDPGGDIHG